VFKKAAREAYLRAIGKDKEESKHFHTEIESGFIAQQK
jgi:hypothetical protein